MTATVQELRNVAVLSHSGAGKTSLVEALLWRAGAIATRGSVEAGTTVSDVTAEEKRRKISIQATIHPLTWRDHPFNLIDTPGYADFVGEIRAALAAADAAMILVSAVSGVAVGTERVWTASGERELSKLLVINKLDRDAADFFRTVTDMRQTLPGNLAAVQVPIGQGDAFRGVVDLLAWTACTWPDGEPVEGAVPDDVAGVAQEYRERLVEAIVETDDDLMMRYLEETRLEDAELRAAFFRAVRADRLTPILVASADKAMGMTQLLDFLIEGVRGPTEHGPLATEEGEAPDLDPEAPFAARVFGTRVDPYLGKVSHLRVLAGTLRAGDTVLDASTGETLRPTHLFVPRGAELDPVKELPTGALGALTKADGVHTGHTLTARERPFRLAPVRLPPPVAAVALVPATRADDDKLGEALGKLLEEDPTLQLERNPDTQETVLWGMGHVHLEVAVGALRDRWGVQVQTHPPRVAYRETVQASAEARYRHKKQSGGAGQFAEVALRVEPAPRGAGFEFAWAVTGGAIPATFQSSCQKGVEGALRRGPLGGFPVVDLRVTVLDGKDHPVDSKDVAFQAAAAQAFAQALQEAQPALLEPVALVKVRVPDRFTGDVVSDLNARRGRILGMEGEGSVATVSAHVPEADLHGYSADLRSLTGGRGAFSRRFAHFDAVPADRVERVLTAARA